MGDEYVKVQLEDEDLEVGSEGGEIPQATEHSYKSPPLPVQEQQFYPTH